MNYQSGKIYTIRSNQTEKYYIGSTCSSLSKRFYDHNKKYKQYKLGKYAFVSSFNILQFNDAYIELLEKCSCKSKNELRKREGELIREHKNNVVNIRIDCRTKKEHYQDNKNVYIEKAQCYYNTNKEQVKLHQKAKYKCECGGKYTNSGKSQHFKTTKHLNFMELKNKVNE